MFGITKIVAICSLWLSCYPLLCQSGGIKIMAYNTVGMDPQHIELAQLALNMTKRFISPHTNTLIITLLCKVHCAYHRQYHRDLMDYFLRDVNMNITIKLNFGEAEDKPWDYHLIVVDSWQALHLVEESFPETQQEREFYFMILLTWDVHLLFPEIMAILWRCLQFQVKNVIILIRPFRQNFISFFSYYSYSRDHCNEQATAQEINRYQEGELYADFLFPPPITNFHGCPLVISGNLLDPLLTFDGDVTNTTHLHDVRRIGGIEGDILKVLADTMNISIQFRFPRELHALNMSANISDAFADLKGNNTEIVIGGLSPILPNSSQFTFSHVYHSTPSVFVVRGGLHFGPIEHLMNPLNTPTWLMILFQCLLAMVIIEIIERIRRPVLRDYVFGPSNRHPIRSLLVTLLGLGTTEPQRNFARCLLMAWILWTFELRNGYQAKMFDSLRMSKRIPVPATIAELIDKDYTLLTPFPTEYYPANKTRITPSTGHELYDLNVSEDRLTIAALLDTLMDFNVKNSHNSTLTYVDQKIYYYQLVMFFKKHSILAGTLNPRLKLLNDAGITAAIADRYGRWEKANVNDPSQAPNVESITNKNLEGLYTICGVMYLMSVLVFVLEMFVGKSRRLKQVMDWMNG